MHFVGLLSDGGVHSHQDQLVALVKIAKENGVKEVMVHVITDGRDTSPNGGAEYVKKLRAELDAAGGASIATLIGRYYAMDRDKRWERTKLAYDLFTSGVGEKGLDPVQSLEASYGNGITDEFVKPVVFEDARKPLIRDGDGILFYNFRADRTRQLSDAWLMGDFDGFERQDFPKVHYVTLTRYDKRYEDMGVRPLFGPQSMKQIFGEVVAAAGMKQCRMAETEKYPHVTYFFNGGIEQPFEGEDRDMSASPKVATYDLQPEMSAHELTDKVLARLDSGEYDLLVLNYANPDMVGHTGVLDAAIKAVETVDACVEKVVEKVLSMGGKLLITADHGNCELMVTPEGKPHTAHTTNLVHFLYVAEDAGEVTLNDGILADVAPTLLDLLGLQKPSEMTGKSLITRK